MVVSYDGELNLGIRDTSLKEDVEPATEASPLTRLHCITVDRVNLPQLVKARHVHNLHIAATL